MTRTKISDAAPQWFNKVNECKLKAIEEKMIKNEETLSVFSRYQKWITVTPRSKNRKHPLEKMKKLKMEETSKIVPSWMQIKRNKEDMKEDTFKSAEYVSSRNNKKFVTLVDKTMNDKKSINQSERKSIFSIGDFRHNLLYKEQADFYSSTVSQLPKNLLAWDDGSVFNPKLKKDSYPTFSKK